MILFLTVGLAMQRQFQLAGQVAMEILVFLGTAVAFLLLADRAPLREVFRLRPLSSRLAVRSLPLGLFAWALAYVLGSLVLMLVGALGGKMPETLYQMLREAPFPFAFLAGAVVPAICEEAVFRGYLQQNLATLGIRWSVLLSGLLFGALHLSLIRLLPLAVLGLIFAEAVRRTGSLWAGVLLHFVNNATALTLAFYLKPGAAGALATPKPSLPAFAFLLAAALLFGAAVVALLRSLGPDAVDQAPSEPAAGAPDPALPDPTSPSPMAHLTALVPLIPAGLIYAWAVAQELLVVFGGSPPRPGP